MEPQTLPGRPRVRIMTETNELPAIYGMPHLPDIGREFTELHDMMSTRSLGGRIMPGKNQSIGQAVTRFQHAVNTRWAHQAGFGNPNQFQALADRVEDLADRVEDLGDHVQTLNGHVLNLVQALNNHAQNIDNQFQNIRDLLNQVLQGQQLQQAQFNASRTNDTARQFNSEILNQRSPATYLGLVKYNQGHPDQNPPAGLVSLIDQLPLAINIPPNGFSIGDAPPLGLTPTNTVQFDRLRRLGDDQKLIALRGIAWFYNENQVQIGATHEEIDNCFETYRRFLFK